MAINKSELARELGISRASLYYKPKREAIDREVKSQIEAVLIDHPDYGHKRVALKLKMGHNRIRRVMKRYGLKPYRRRVKRPSKNRDQGRLGARYGNLLAELLEKELIIGSNQLWSTDFTYIKYQGKFIYLATIIDVFTREIVGLNISRYHNRYLVIGALEDALKTHPAPQVIHSDQGSEYDSEEFTSFVQLIGAKMSMSEKGSPWQNGHKESFYSHFKLEAGDLNRFDAAGELIEYIYQQIYYYNHKRIHSVLKMTPVEFRKRHLSKKSGT